MLINAIDPEESRIAVVEDGVLQELHVELANREAYLGNIYKGKVVNIEPSIGAAFVAFGGRVNGFLHVSDILPAYGRPDFVLDDVIEGRARVDVDDGPESMQQALADDDEEDAAEPAGGADAGPDLVAEESNVVVAVGEDEDNGEPRLVDIVDADEVGVHGGDNDEPRGADGGDEPDGGAGDDAEPEAPAPPEPSDDPEQPPRHRRGFGHGIDEQPLNMAAASDVPDAGDGSGLPGDGKPIGEPTAAAETAEPAEGVEGGERGERPAGKRGGRDRRRRREPRGRDPRNDRRPRGPRPTIDQLLKKGQEVVVQITKEGIGSKGPTLTTYVSLPGRCLVLMPSLPKCGVSRKIEDGRERKRLKRIVRELDETGSGGIGFIVRTAGINKSLQDLERDRDYLKKIWEMVAQRLKVTRAPALLYQESDLVLKAMRDQFTRDIADVVVDSEDVFLRIRDFADKLMPHMADRIKQHAMTTPLFHHFGIEKEVEALYQPKIDLSNGASIVIDQAEALVAIDVNSGKYKAGGDTDETAYRTNLEAIPEIVRQLRLRDLGGLIIIDFIDMSHEKHRRGVEKRLIDALRGDRARIKVGRISPFGMLEITRQRVGPGLKRTVFMQCTHCKGSGWSRTVQSKALSVLRESRALVNLKGFSVLQVFVAPPVSDYLVNYKRRGILELEDAVGKTIVFRPEPSYPIDVVHYRFLTGDGQEARIAIPAGLGVKA
ncbi:MAG TPA: Rne/Rng family ribonuclease [Planctomycetota bacterium]|nr:Rne/Rng family ribonuclease [Planctomycetota bacterium]